MEAADPTVQFDQSRFAKVDVSFLRKVIESAEEGIWIASPERKTLYVNARICQLLGYAAEEMVGRDILDFVDEDSRKKLIVSYSRRLQGVSEQYELQFRNRYGVPFDLRIAAFPLFDSSGKFQGSVALVTDITEQKEMQRRLSDSETYLRTLIANLPLVLMAFDKQARFTHYDGLALKSIGKKPGERIGETIEQAWGGFVPKASASFKRAVKGEACTSLEMLHGRMWETHWQPLTSGKRITGVVAIAVDVTERQDLMNEIDSRRELLQGILDNMEEGVFAVNADRQVWLANKTALRFMGLKSERQLPFSMKDAPNLLNIRGLDGNPLSPEVLTVARALKGEENVPPLVSIMRVPGTTSDLFTQSCAAPFRQPQGDKSGAVVIIRDVTRFVELDRMKDQFIRVAAHELKTPVTLVKLNAQMLQKLMPEVTPQQQTLLHNLSHGADRIERIINNLLDLSLLQAGTIWMSHDSFDLNELINEIADATKQSASHRPVRFKNASSAVMISGDRTRIRQVVDILIENAIKYSPSGGDVQLILSLTDGKASVSVQDHGVGIEAGKQAHIFDCFYSAHTGTPGDLGGLGVGLYIAREIIVRHGGEIGCKSVVGSGSVFSFTLPYQPGKSK